MSFTRLRYHIVTATKHRHPVIDEALERVLYPALHKANEQGARLLQIGGVPDHVHLVAAVPPTQALADFVRAVLADSSLNPKGGETS